MLRITSNRRAHLLHHADDYRNIAETAERLPETR